jgi:D-3-phosphoglycerate dehydrogenase
MQNPFWLINTARGKAVNTEDLVIAIKSGKILGAGLDVLEYESSSFYSIFNDNKKNSSLTFLKNSKQVILTPHVGGWTLESHKKLSETILDKIRAL